MPQDPLHAAIAGILGAAHVLTEPADLAPYITDWRGRYHGTARMVVRPGSAAEVAAVVRLAAEHGVPIIPQGGNTGTCAAAIPDDSGRAIVLRLERMNRVRDISPIDGTMVVEAGCILQTLQQVAAEAGMLFPLSLGAEGSCQIGGNISTNAGGTAVLRYGPMRDLVLGLEVVLADGSLHDWLTPLRKNTAGYDLKQIFIGAEGTLGIVTAAAVKIFPKPGQSATAMLALDDLDAALALLLRLRETLGDRLSSCEIINRAQADVVLAHVPGVALPFAAPAPWYAIIEVTDTLTLYDLRAALENVLHAALEGGIITDAVIAGSQAQADALWKFRHSVGEANKRAGFPVTHDTAVPVRAQPHFVEQVRHRLQAAFPAARLHLVGHLGDGNIHVIVLLDPARHEPAALAKAIGEINVIVDEASLALGGTISAEHGIGRINKQRLLQGRGTADVALMARLKAAIDPQGLLNPGNLFDLGGATE